MQGIIVTQTASPSRSKMAGPCWITVNGTYAAEKPREIPAARGDKIEVAGKATLRRKTRTDTQRDAWTLYATGNPADTMTVGVGHGQSGFEVQALISGVSETPPPALPEPDPEHVASDDPPGADSSPMSELQRNALGHRATAAELMAMPLDQLHDLPGCQCPEHQPTAPTDRIRLDLKRGEGSHVWLRRMLGTQVLDSMWIPIAEWHTFVRELDGDQR